MITPKLDLQDLRAKAEVARLTWHCAGPGYCDFIDTANPATVLELLDIIAHLECCLSERIEMHDESKSELLELLEIQRNHIASLQAQVTPNEKQCNATLRGRSRCCLPLGHYGHHLAWPR